LLKRESFSQVLFNQQQESKVQCEALPEKRNEDIPSGDEDPAYHMVFLSVVSQNSPFFFLSQNLLMP
jgi:hypothetical protein